MNENFVMCRAIGHAWTGPHADPRPDDASMFRVRSAFRCSNCTTWRYDSYNYYGEVESRSYDYPDGYKFAKDEMPTRAQFRMMMMKKDPVLREQLPEKGSLHERRAKREYRKRKKAA